MCSDHMGTGELSFLILLKKKLNGLFIEASQFVILIFKSPMDSLTKLNVLTGSDREVRVGPLKTF